MVLTSKQLSIKIYNNPIQTLKWNVRCLLQDQRKFVDNCFCAISDNVQFHQRKQFLKTKLATSRQIKMFQQNHKQMFRKFGFCIIAHNTWTPGELRIIKRFERLHLPKDARDVCGQEWKPIFNLFVCLFIMKCSLYCCVDDVFVL